MTDTLQDDNEPVELKDLFFDPECNPSTRKGKEACISFIELFLQAEQQYAPRKRKRKGKDEEILKDQLSAIVGNLVAGSVRKKPTPVAITQSKSILGKKDSHKILNDKLPDVLDILAATQLVTLTPGSYSEGRQTTIEAGTAGLQLIRTHGLTRNDFRHKDRKPIVLRARKTAEERKKDRPGKELELPDTDEAKRMAAEVDRFNEYLSKQVIEYVGDREDVDDERKTTHRVFNNGRLCEGGRLYGGFWQSLAGAKDGKPDEREDDICINGEHLVGLDYGQIAVRILYSFEDVQIDMEDAYLLPGWENSREGIKKLLNTMINDPAGEPKAVRKLFGNRRGLKVPELTKEAIASIYQHHGAIKGNFAGTSSGRLFYEESNHLMRLLMELIDMDIPALPVHDCLYVRMSNVDTVRELMRTRFIEYFKVSIYVS